MLAAKKLRLRENLKPATPIAVFVALLLCCSIAGLAQNKEAGAWALRECWRYETTDLVSSASANDGTNLYFGERGGRITAVGVDDGKRVWASEVGGELVSNVLVIDRELLLVIRPAEGPYELRSLSVVSGIASRSVSLPMSGHVRIYAAGNRMVILSDAGDMAAVDPKAGKQIWAKRLGAAPKVFIPGEYSLIAGYGDGQIAFIDPTDGRVVRSMSVEYVPSALLLIDHHLVFGDERGNITNLDIDKDNTVWKFKSGGKISGIYPVSDSELLVTSFDNFTYLVSRANGHVIWKRRQPSRIVEAAIVNSSYAGVTPIGEASVLFFNPGNGKALGQVAMPSSVEFVQPPQIVGDSVITFSTEGIASTGFFGCKRNEKAEAKTSAFK